MKTKLYVTAAFASLLLISCQREVDESLPGGVLPPGTSALPADLSGTYKVVGLDAHDSSSTTATQIGFNTRAVSITNYKGLDITGTFTFTKDKLATNGYGYRVSTTSEVRGYIDGTLVSQDHFPFDVTIPPTTSEASYVRNSSDSLTLSGSSGFASAGQNVGLRLSMKDDTLMLLLKVSINQTFDNNGTFSQVNNNVTQVIKLKK